MRWYNGYTIYKVPMHWTHAINFNVRGGFIYKQRGTGNTTKSTIMIDTLAVERTDRLEGYRAGIFYVGLSRTKKMYMLADGTGLGKIETTKYNELYLDFMASPFLIQYGRSHDFAEIPSSNNYDVTSTSMKFDTPPFQNVMFGARIGGYQMTSSPKHPKSFFLYGWEIGYYPGPKPNNFEGLFKFSWLFGVK